MPEFFPLRPSGDFIERYAYRTSLMTSRTLREQRRRMRVYPVGSFEYSFVGRPGRDEQLVQRLLARAVGVEWWVPWWPYTVRLTAPLASGSSTIEIDDPDIPYGGNPGYTYLPVGLWTDPDTFEVVNVLYTDDTTIYLDGVTTKDWPVGTCVMPVARGWITDAVQDQWPSFDVVTGGVTFQLARTGDPFLVEMEAAPEIETWDMVPVRGGRISGSIERPVSSFATGVGERVAYLENDAARRRRTYRWRLDNRHQVRLMRDFLDRRYGRAIPFWMPSWQRDFTLTAPAAADATALTFVEHGYASDLFPQGDVYRSLYLLKPGGAASVSCKVTAAVDNGDGTETVSLAAPLGTAVDTSWRAMYLRHCRLDVDAVEIRWRNAQVATTDIPVREIPEEAA